MPFRLPNGIFNVKPNDEGAIWAYVTCDAITPYRKERGHFARTQGRPGRPRSLPAKERGHLARTQGRPGRPRSLPAKERGHLARVRSPFVQLTFRI